MSSVSFTMPEGAIALSGDSAAGSQKKDEKDPVELQGMQLAGVSRYDMMADNGGIDVNGWGQNFDNIAEQISLTGLEGVNTDTVSQQVGDSGNENLLRELRELADRTGDSLGKLTTLEEDVDQSYERLYGSRNKNLSEAARMEHFATYDPERLGIDITPPVIDVMPEGTHMVGNGRHEQDGVQSDVRAMLTNYTVSMNALGIDFDELNGALSRGGAMESIGQMRDALQGLNNIAMSRAGFAGFGAFFQALDADLFERQKVENPKAEVRPALGTPEPEVTPPQYALNNPNMNGPNTNPGIAPGAPTIRV